jgi:hypothetical protein
MVLITALNAGLAESAPPPPEAGPISGYETVEEAFGIASPDDLVAPAGLQRANVAPRQLTTPSLPITLPNPVWRVGIVTDGLYTLDYATLTAAGVDLDGVSPDDVHLLWRGQEVSLDPIGMEDGTIDPSDRFVFYGEKFHGSTQDEKYTDENVYWLAVDAASAGARMATRWVTPTGTADPVVGCLDTTVLEENARYWGRWTVDPGTDTTWFFWDRRPAWITHTFELPLTSPITTESANLEMSLALEGISSAYTMYLSLNDTPLGSEYWIDQAGLTLTFDIPAGILHDGLNKLAFYFESYYNGSVTYQKIYLDRFTVTYTRSPVLVEGVLACEVPVSGTYAYTVTQAPADARLYDVTDPRQPVRLAGYPHAGGEIHFQDDVALGDRYHVETPQPAALEPYTPALDLLSPGEGADYIIVAPEVFIPTLQPLLDHRESQGQRVRAVPVEDIYPLFNGGIYHPEAIRAFVAYAHETWPGDPFQYLFLVGDGHINFKRYNTERYGDTPVWIPPYLEFDDPTQGEVPLDSRYGDIDGDGIPEVYVGRVPAETLEQVDAYVTKLLSYENGPMGAWNARVMLIADNGKISDEGFDSSLDRIARQYFNGRIDVQRFYMDDYNIPPSNSTRFPTYTQDVVDAWNQGASMIVYAGHGSITRWADEPILYNTELVSLTEDVKLPFLISLDCLDGYYMFPSGYLVNRDARSFGEWLTTVLTDSGAIAHFAPAGLSYTAPAESLAKGFMARMATGERRLGPLTQAGREAIPNGIFYSYVSRIFTLLGDPAMELKIMYHRVYLPLTISNG